MKPRLLGERGIALTITIILIIASALLAAAALSVGYQYRRLREGVGALHTQAYYRAQAGVVDARWRIRNNIGANYLLAGTDPAPYQLDIDGDAVMDVTVDIGAADGNGLRQILATGRD
ncbi:MAG: hypothetical protein MOGMAGMI_00967 [Candidatus Omnitrophica bacterium]|nr:hypothetical protein [Candidatus Omnitrophota bacterium]